MKNGELKSLPMHVHDEHGRFDLVAFVDGYVVARRKGCMPAVFYLKEWMRMAAAEEKAP